MHPVAVKALASGRYEIVSGHHRVDAFRALERAAVPVVVVDIDEAIVDRTAFYANLLQPSLPDFEKYLGFRRERERTGATQKELARAAGIAESTLSMLFSFDRCPMRARELIEDRPEGDRHELRLRARPAGARRRRGARGRGGRAAAGRPADAEGGGAARDAPAGAAGVVGARPARRAGDGARRAARSAATSRAARACASTSRTRTTVPRPRRAWRSCCRSWRTLEGRFIV